MNEDENLDLLDLDDASSDSLPDAAPLVAPRPKKPWLLMCVGLAVIVLATFVIVRTISSENTSSVDIDLDAPAIMVDGDVADIQPVPKADVVAPMPQPAAKPVQQPAPAPVAKVDESASAPVRVIDDRKEVTFNPDKKPAAKPAAKPASKPAVKQATQKPVAKTNANSWYVQLGSYSSRSLAESGERQLRRAHPALFDGQNTVILAAVLKNGTTTYRLRAVFNNQNDANGFCRNAKSDGLDCYVAK